MASLKFTVLFVSSIIIVGCTAPQHVIRAISTPSTALTGPCKELFLAGGLGKYQHIAQAPLGGRAVFALAVDGSTQYCGWSSTADQDARTAFALVASHLPTG